MYLSRLILNPRSRQVQREIANPYEMHRTILRAFPETLPLGERVLFRLEIHPRSGLPTLLVQSQTLPAWSWLTEKDYLLPEALLPLGVENPAAKTADLQLRAGQALSFRLRANPTVKKDRPNKKQGHRVGIYKEEEQLKWLERKLAEAGARLLSARTGRQENVSGSLHRDDQRHNLSYAAVQFDGTIEVRDPALLIETVREGLGSAKGFGFGLLSLAPAASAA